MFATFFGWFNRAQVRSLDCRVRTRPMVEEMEQRALPSAAFPTTVAGESVRYAVANARELALDDYGPFPVAAARQLASNDPMLTANSLDGLIRRDFDGANGILIGMQLPAVTAT